MRLALSGYGKMGKAVERSALKRSHEIIAKIDCFEHWADQLCTLQSAHCVIDFSTPETAADNILRIFHVGVPVVVGTTGWLDRWDEIVNVCLENQQTLFYASNFSIGVNIFFELNRNLAKLMNSSIFSTS